MIFRRDVAVAAALGGLGLVQMAADVAGLTTLRGLTAALGASPAPKVFSSAGALETFSTDFILVAGDREIRITPEVYSRLGGPYPRRNAYGAALAYGPVLLENEATRAMGRSVLRHALCGRAPLLEELGLPTGAPVRMRLETRGGGVLVLDPECP